MSTAYYQIGKNRVAAIDADCNFPPLNQALTEPNGLIAIGGDLSPKRLLTAYRQGIFPWYSADEPILWWSPNPRMVLFTDELKVSRSLKKVIKQNRFEIRFNTAFAKVIESCSLTPRPQQTGTWICPMIIEAYTRLHDLGYAVSMESWQEGELVGGCYGIKIGHMFYGESMFHHVADASKVAFVYFVRHLKAQGVEMIDCQMNTPLLASFGACEISRQAFMRKLRLLIDES